MDIENAQIKIDSFVAKWQKPMQRYCHNNQKQAAYYLWLQFLLGLRSLSYLAAANQITGCFILARSCLECDISISAIIEDASLGDSYINYGVHARNRYIEAEKKMMDPKEHQELLQYMASRFGPEFPNKKATKWHPKSFYELCKTAKRECDYQSYIAFCQLTHATIMGKDILSTLGLMGEHKTGETSKTLLSIYTLSFIKTTLSVLNLIYGKLWTKEKQNCMNDYNALGASIVTNNAVL